jgi:hypothetical protein
MVLVAVRGAELEQGVQLKVGVLIEGYDEELVKVEEVDAGDGVRGGRRAKGSGRS